MIKTANSSTKQPCHVAHHLILVCQPTVWVGSGPRYDVSNCQHQEAADSITGVPKERKEKRFLTNNQDS